MKTLVSTNHAPKNISKRIKLVLDLYQREHRTEASLDLRSTFLRALKVLGWLNIMAVLY